MLERAERQTPPNNRMKLTKRACLVRGPALARLRRAVFIESRFAVYARLVSGPGKPP